MLAELPTMLIKYASVVCNSKNKIEYIAVLLSTKGTWIKVLRDSDVAFPL